MANPEQSLIPHYNTVYRPAARACALGATLLGNYDAHNDKVLDAVANDGAFIDITHRSAWEPVLVGLELHKRARPIHYVAKDELMHIPVLGKTLRAIGAIGVVRNTGRGMPEETQKHIDRIVQSGGLVGILSEGHRNKFLKDADQLDASKQKSTIALLALVSGKPILPVGVAGSYSSSRLPAEVIFGNPIYPDQRNDIESPEFNVAKHALMNEIWKEKNYRYKQARELFLHRLERRQYGLKHQILHPAAYPKK